MSASSLKDFDALIKKENQRGVQLGLRRPELYLAQINAIFQAYAQSLTEVDEDGLPIKTNLEVMIPMVRSLEEFETAKAMVEEGAEKFGFSPSNYRVGMMGETVRAMSDIKTFASKTPFVSIGSNDLSFEVLGLSRFGNTSKHISVVEDGARHPSVTLFREVSDFILDAIDKARIINPKIEIDLCGAHAADLSSLKKLQKANLSSVSLIPSGRNHHALKADWALYNWGLWKKGLCP
jgi:phosphoenolpyruvate-protein kinase (PTS system EI component)